jgi:protein-disulfide isomerase
MVLLFLLSASTVSAAADQDKEKKDNAAPITRQQADQILYELKLIRLLLEKQDLQRANAAAQPSQPAAPPIERAKVSGTGLALGSKDAPITIVEFTDYQCPFCNRFHGDAFQQLKKAYIDTGKVRFIARDLPLDFHPFAMPAALAARCAGEQGKFWEMRDALIEHAANLKPDDIANYARNVGLAADKFQACLGKNDYSAQIQKDIAEAGAVGISGTPSFVIGPTAGTIDGVKIVGALPYSNFDQILQQMLAAQVTTAR